MQLITIKLKKQVCSKYTAMCNKPKWYIEDLSVRYTYAFISRVFWNWMPEISRGTIGYDTEDYLITNKYEANH